MRGTSNSNVRGSSYARAARKRWLLINYAADVATPLDSEDRNVLLTCRCYRCGDLLTFATLTVDRIIPGCRGGTYRRNNIRPACAQCNSETGGRTRS